MAKVVGDGGQHRRRNDGALQTDFPTSVGNVFTENPKAAMVIEGDFVPGASRRRSSRRTGYNVFPSRRSTARRPAVVGGGDIMIMFKDKPATQAFVEYLATPEARADLGEAGRLSSPNKNARSRAPIPTRSRGRPRRAIGEAEASASTSPTCSPRRSAPRRVRASGSSSRTSSKNPNDVDGIAQQMEAAAAKAYG